MGSMADFSGAASDTAQLSSDLPQAVDAVQPYVGTPDALSPQGAMPTDAFDPSMAPGIMASGAAPGGDLGDPGTADAWNNPAITGGSPTTTDPGTAGGGTPTTPSPVSPTTTNVPTNAVGVGKSDVSVGSHEALPAADTTSKAAAGGGSGANMNLIQSLLRGIGGMGGGGQMNPMQMQQMLNAMGTPNQGGLMPGQRAQLRMMAHNMRSQAIQNMWNAGITNPRGDSRYPAMMNNIRTQMMAQAQSMIQQNFQNSLAQNQQLMNWAQLQMGQNTQYANAIRQLMGQMGLNIGRTNTGGGTTVTGANTGANAPAPYYTEADTTTDVGG